MNITFLRSLLLGTCCAVPLGTVAGDIGVIAPIPPRIDIPAITEGWGFFIEGAAMRGYNNNFDYLISSEGNTIFSAGSTLISSNDIAILNVDPVYAFDLRVGVDYTLAAAGNIIKLYYEHLFDRQANDSYQNSLGDISKASARQKLDEITLSSEQHILIGPAWETTITGGMRFSHVAQKFNPQYFVAPRSSFSAPDILNSGATMQFDGAGPLAAIGTIFNLTGYFSLGAEAQAALLMGLNKISYNIIETQFFDDGTINETFSPAAIDNLYSLVPEFSYRIYGNYFYRFMSGSELEIELGWRATQFFNLRTFAVVSIKPTQLSLSPLFPTDLVYTDATNSDDIGFSGPYLMAHIRL